MTMTASELQAYVDAGRVPSTSGTSEISTPIICDGSQRVLFEPNSFVWTGSGTRGLFEFDTVEASPLPIIFKDVKAVSEVDGSSIFKIVDLHAQPNNLVFDTCHFEATGAYCIDLNNVGYIITPVFRNMFTVGSGAIRIRGSENADYWHATSQMIIDGWTHTGSNRVGPAWNFRGTSGLYMDGCTDKGSMDLNADLVSAGWEGPLTLLFQAPRTPATIRNLQTEWSDLNDDNAPNCYIGEIRTDLNTGNGQHNYVDLINPTLRHSAVDSGVKPWRIMGSNGLNNHAIVVNIVCAESPSVDDFLVGGKGTFWFTKPWYKPGEETTGDTLKSLADSLFVGGSAFQDVIETSTTKLPSNDSSSATTYSGSQNETNYAAEPPQYEEALEG